MDNHLKILVTHFSSPSVFVFFIQAIGVRIQQKEKTIIFARFCRAFFQRFLFKRIAQLTIKDGWLKLVTNSQVIHRGKNPSKEAAFPLVGAEGDKCRRRKIAVLVRGQVDWVEGQLS